jgi:hypothetical protein
MAATPSRNTRAHRNITIERALPGAAEIRASLSAAAERATFDGGPEWRNWQTQQTQNLPELCSVWVRLPPPGPNSVLLVYLFRFCEKPQGSADSALRYRCRELKMFRVLAPVSKKLKLGPFS